MKFIKHMLTIGDGSQVEVLVPDGATTNIGDSHILLFGEPSDGCLVRVHSKCIYGEAYGSAHCDCRGQLDKAIALLGADGGVLIYLDQEGRGAGLAAKARAYVAATQGMNTFASYRHQGLPEDPRSYELAIAMLNSLGISRCTLLTNNPLKVRAFLDRGLVVTRSAIEIGPTKESLSYLLAKQSRGHFITGLAPN